MVTNELELIKRIKSGDEIAKSDLYYMYKSLVSSIARKYYLIGGDIEDLIQEGMLGLFRAVDMYDHDKNDNFMAYAYIIIERAIIYAIRRNNTEKEKQHQDLFIASTNDGMQFPDEELSPEEYILQNEKAEELLDSIREHLSPQEKKVFKLYLEGYNYHDIADTLGKSDKSIDNALNRIKTKSRIILKGE